jgi:hypothetical protein
MITIARYPVMIIVVFFSLQIGACGSGMDEDVRDASDDRGSGDTGGGEDQGERDVVPDVPEDGPDDGPTEVVDYVPFEDICGEEDLPLEYDVESDVLIVLDRSGSMALMLRRVKDAINAVVGASDDKIWFGLMPFPNSVPPNECRMMNPLSQCAAPVTPQVALGPNRAPDIAAALEGLGLCGSTPTTETLRNARSYLASSGTGHTQYVLLATDGVPNCNSSLDGTTCTCLDEENGCADQPEACLDDEACYEALDELLGDGVKTYVLGMGSWAAADSEVMNHMAEHGGTGSFYPAEDPGEIITAFEAIMGTVVLSCRFDLHPTEDVDENKVNFYIDGELVPMDPSHEHGWDYVDEDTVEFYGEWCERIMSGDISGVSATYGCPTIVI